MNKAYRHFNFNFKFLKVMQFFKKLLTQSAKKLGNSNEIFLPPLLHKGRGWSHCPPIHCNVSLPTSAPSLHFTVAFVPSLKSALLNLTFPFWTAFSMFQQFTVFGMKDYGNSEKSCILSYTILLEKFINRERALGYPIKYSKPIGFKRK